MENKEKKIAAISAGVAYYLQEEQEALQSLQQTEAQTPTQPRRVFPVNSPWAMTGRQAIMDRRLQWQLRMAR